MSLIPGRGMGVLTGKETMDTVSEIRNTKGLILLSGDVESNPGPGPPLRISARNNQTRDQHDRPHDDVGQARGDHDKEAVGRDKGKPSIKVKALTYNVRGLNDQNKVRHLLNLFNKAFLSKEYDTVIALQETNILKEGIIPYVWRGNLVMTMGTGNSKGCITLLSSHLNVVEKVDFEERGHVVACQKTGSNLVEYIIANIYAPNAHNTGKIDFFEKVFEKIAEFEIKYSCDNVIVLGDLNLVLKESETKNRLYTNNEKRVGKVIQSLFRDLNLTDIWQGQTSEYTWRRANTDTFSTLDRILYRSGLLEPISIKVDWSLGFSDHAAVEVSFKNKVLKERGKRIRPPRLDPSLLKDEKIKKSISEELRTLVNMAPNHWDSHTKLEYAKMCLRTVAERRQAERNRKERTLENEIDEAVNRAIKELAEEVQEEHKIEIIERIENLRNRKISIIEEKGTRLAERLSTKWYNEGEKSTRYFYRLLNRQMPDKMCSLEGENGVEITEESKINEEVVKFYKELYEQQEVLIDNENDLNFFNNVNAISGDEEDEIVGEIKASDLLETLRTCQDSAPGPDGITYSYLRAFWDIFGPLITESWRQSLVTKKLPDSHRKSILRLIPKAGKDLKKLTNWRPITLSNCDHKLITKTYAIRLTKKLDREIKPRQTAYLKGRVITDNVRALLSCVHMSNVDDEIDGIITSLDAKKAFDSVNHDYIRSCLKKFGVEKFIPIFDTLYKDLESDIAINGSLIKGYRILRGVKQGDALSCILFIMCMEPLLRNIEANRNIVPILSRVYGVELPKTYAYADDVNLVTKNDPRTTREIFVEYGRLSKISGLMLNAEKTEILRLNKESTQEINYQVTYLGRRVNLKSQPEVKINGILFQQDEERMRTRNFDEVARKITKKLTPWSRRNLTLLGKILLTKTYGISQIIYIMQCFVLNQDSTKLLNSIIYKFMWNRHFQAAKAPERIKREIINLPIKFGGFGMLDLIKLDKSIKLRILGRMIVSNHRFNVSVKNLLDLGDFFYPNLKIHICNVTHEAVTFLRQYRNQLLSNPDLINKVKLLSLVKETRIKNILTNNGLNSLHYFQLRIQGIRKVGQLDRDQLNRIKGLIKVKELTPWIAAAIQIQIPPPSPSDYEAIWYNDRLTSIAQLTTKQIREPLELNEPITSFKIGVNLEVNESLTWCHRIKKLTATRHQNCLLKIAHGDMYTNDRLMRFGLRDNDNCDRCGNTDSRTHRIASCPKALELWNELRRLNSQTRLREDNPDLVKEVLGMTEPIKSELVIHAEILQCLNAGINSKLNSLPAKVTLKVLLSKLYSVESRTTKENIKALLDKIGE